MAEGTRSGPSIELSGKQIVESADPVRVESEGPRGGVRRRGGRSRLEWFSAPPLGHVRPTAAGTDSAKTGWEQTTATKAPEPTRKRTEKETERDPSTRKRTAEIQ